MSRRWVGGDERDAGGAVVGTRGTGANRLRGRAGEDWAAAGRVVEAINRGETEIGEPGLAEALRAAVEAGTLWATTDTTAGAMEADVVIVIVPVALTGTLEVDFRHIDSAAGAVGAGLRRGALVVFESTLPVTECRFRHEPHLL